MQLISSNMERTKSVDVRPLTDKINSIKITSPQEPDTVLAPSQSTTSDKTATTSATATVQSPTSTTATTTTSLNTRKNLATSSKYVRYFESIFVPVKVELLRNKAQSGQLRHCQFRSLCWRYFLHCLPEQYEDWLPACKRSRVEYERVRGKHLSSIRTKSIDDAQAPNTPAGGSEVIEQQASNELLGDQRSATLSTSSEAKQGKGGAKSDKSQRLNDDLEEERRYAQASKDCDHKNVFRTIERDVVRTFPDMEFFRQTEMQDIMSNILYNFASENPQLSYKQGMHELIATLLYVAHTDSQNCLIHYEGEYANEAIATLLDLKFLEHDVYYLFCGLMRSIETWYQNDEILIIPNENANSRLRSQNELVNRSSGSSSKSKLTSARPQYSSVLGLKLKKISENIVKSYDSELFYHLEALQIAPQIYGIRWMRLLFGREFEFLDLLTVWDAIICDQDPMSLVDYVFASMLITIREELVNSDYTNCLNKLMRYQFKDVAYVTKLALYLRDPINYSRPKSSSINQSYVSYPKFDSHPKQRIPNNVSRPPLKHTSNRLGPSGSSGSPKNAFDVSTESHEDLHSIVDYCWRLLSEQIDSLQRCLPKEKGLSSEDEIFVAVAQLKKVRDVLKGSLRLEDELESTSTVKKATQS